ncbi:hypothetical protein ACIBG8_33350 [Nonomuraea sp. NPDC050556]|uniref:hypothetical protein n=1 Tax=Nonomuraea sp. NPDC050556 TaxID=3364369 RepID=UPI00379F5757
MIIDLREASVRYRATGLQVLHGVDLRVDSGGYIHPRTNNPVRRLISLSRW